MKKSEIDFALTCPGGLQAEFMGRNEGLLQWRGFLPPLSGALGDQCIEYVFYTDESGREVHAPVKRKTF